MMNIFKKMLLLLTLVALAAGCAPLAQPPLKPLDATATKVDGKYAPKIANFQVILDASFSMVEEGDRDFITARNTASRINQSIPTDLEYNGGLRSFGHSSFQSKNLTDMLYGMTRYERGGFHEGLNKIKYVGGTSPLAAALTAAGQDLKSASGKSALIVISDGLDMADAPDAAKALKAAYGDNLCIYTIAVGNQRNGSGHELLQKVADAGQCGFATTAAALADNTRMAAFINDVFLTEPAPKPAPVPAPAPAPAVMDSDGDGVPDHLDKCPGTPKGVRVDAEGCPTVMSIHINFGFDSSTVAATYDTELAKAAACINNYPGHEVFVSGHTDSTGPEVYNQGLSERRAQAVVKRLAEKFNIPANKMKAVGFGETKPIADNNTAEGRTQNRRVDVACGADVQ